MWNTFYSLGGVGDFVVGEDVVGASHGQPDAVLVVLKDVVGNLSVETFHHRHSSVAVVVDVVVCNMVKDSVPHQAHKIVVDEHKGNTPTPFLAVR